MISRSGAPSPKPEVLYLPALFRGIRSGEIRVPAFQRGFVWKPAQIIELLESVYRGFPIGSLLFWRAPMSAMLTDTSGEIPFPHPSIAGEVDFVLDGMQRLASLYGAFNAPDKPPATDSFAIAFDVRNERFLAPRESNETSISLRRLFHPRDLLEEQARLGRLPGGDALVDRTLELQRTFQEYLVPVIRISGAAPAQVVQIFERVNNTGTKLSAVDFMRALTWSRAFDLSDQIQKLSDSISDLRFEVPYDALAKAIALSLDIAPTGEEMVRLRDKSDSELFSAVDRTASALRGAIKYFQRELRLQSYDFVPYEGQFLVATSIALAHSDALPSWYREWFWTVGFSEALQGRPDHAIARLAIEARNAIPTGLPERLALSADTLISRSIRRGAALGMTFVASIAGAPACSVMTGETIPYEIMTSDFDTRMLGAVFERSALQSAGATPAKTDKLLCNVVLLAPAERNAPAKPSLLREAILTLAEQEGGVEKLKTQCIDGECVRAVRLQSAQAFLAARARAIVARARLLSGASRSA